MKVLVTGAYGQVGTAIIDSMADTESYDFTFLDRQKHPEYETVVADIASDSLTHVFDGNDAVVHLAASPKPDDPWEEILRNNIIGMYNVMEATRKAQVETLVFASTNHVMGNYELQNSPDLYDIALDFKIDHTDPVRPDSYYAISKLLGEQFGRHYVENHPFPKQFYALRICNVSDEEYDDPYGRAEQAVQRGEYKRGSEEYNRRVARRRSMWCSRRDIAQLVDRCLQDRTVEFDVFYGVSDNPKRWFDISHARHVVGYDPQDDASEWDKLPDRYRGE